MGGRGPNAHKSIRSLRTEITRRGWKLHLEKESPDLGWRAEIGDGLRLLSVIVHDDPVKATRKALEEAKKR